MSLDNVLKGASYFIGYIYPKFMCYHEYDEKGMQAITTDRVLAPATPLVNQAVAASRSRTGLGTDIS